MRLSAIVAISKNHVIGRDGDMPWHIPTDLKHFKATTIGKPMIMGRRTWESIGGYLKGRELIVVSRSGLPDPKGAHVVGSLDHAIDKAREIAGRDGVDEIMIMGGGQIYAQAMAKVDRLIISHVDMMIDDGDTWFPEIEPAIWREVDRADNCGGERDSANFSIVVYDRR